MKQIVAISARSGSTRLPFKSFMEFGDSTVLKFMHDRVQDALRLKNIDQSIVILGHYQDDDLRAYCDVNKLDLHQAPADENDLTARHMSLFENTDADSVVRLTSDCPLINTDLVAEVLNYLLSNDYVTNTSPRTFVDGWDVQGITKDAFYWYAGQNPREEHLFYQLENDCSMSDTFIKAGFTIKSLINENRKILNPYHPGNKLSVDTREDLDRVRTYWEEISKKV